MSKLRFKDSTNQAFPNWKTIELEMIAFKVNKKNKDSSLTNVLTNSAVQGIVCQSDYFERDIVNENNLAGYYVVEKDDFVYNPRISSNALVGPIKRNKIDIGVMSPLYTVFKFKEGNLDFFEQYFQTNHWHEYIKSVSNSGIRHDRMNISSENFLRLPLPYPILEEQTKIANFLSAIDEKISQIAKKCELLAQYKKGLMQKIFTRKLRFKNSNNVEFSGWKSAFLGDLCSIATGKLDANAMVDSGSYRFYTCAKEFYKIDSYAFDTDALLISGNGANVGYIHHYKGKFNAYQRTYVLDKFNENILYIKYFLDAFLPIRIFKEAKEGNTPYIVMNTLTEMPIQLPTLLEQNKIANFLEAIDKKITVTQSQLNLVKQYKQGLMQKIFI
jgi:type I restriction enzyme S subunit